MSTKVTVGLNEPNSVANFYPADDKWEMKMYPMKASTAMLAGAAIMPETSGAATTGYFTEMGVENAGGDDFEGILAEPIASTDSDYATAGKLKGVWVPKHRNAEAYFRVGSGTFTTAIVGSTVELYSDSASLAVGTLGKGATVTAYISSTKGKCRFDLPRTETA